MYHRPEKGVRNGSNSWLLQLLRELRSTSIGMLILVCVIARYGATIHNVITCS